VLEDVDRAFTALLARTLEFDPALSHAEAAGRVALLARENGLAVTEDQLLVLANRLRRHAVINPQWLRQDNISQYFFLANGLPGMLGQVIRDAQRQRVGVSQYVLYGHWDSLLALYGSADEAARLLTGLQDGAYEGSFMFAAQDVLLSYHQRTSDFVPAPEATAENINPLALDYDAEGSRELRERLLQANVILGPAITLEDNYSPYPIIAFVGITVIRARSPITGIEVLETLQSQPDLRSCLTDLYQVEQGVPYHYFAKLACVSVKELDAATNAVAFASRGGTRFEGETLVVAHGLEQIPLVRKADVASLLVTPDVGPIVRAAQHVFDLLSRDEQATFNTLPQDRQLATLRALSGLQVARDDMGSGNTERIETALSTFVRECTKSTGDPNLTGAVVEITTLVENTARTFLSRLAYSVYGDNPAAFQSELQLPTRQFNRLTLGKVAQALRTARSLPGFADLTVPLMPDSEPLLADSWIDRLGAFADERNSWAHGAAWHTGTQIVDEAFSTMREGIQITGWLTRGIAQIRQLQATRGAPAQQPEPEEQKAAFELPKRKDRSAFSVFVSHSTSDKEIAERLANGLQAVGYQSWYAGWRLTAGDSILNKIEAALSAMDVLVVVLSRKSVESNWVQRELDTALLRQLDGQDVLVIPILIEDCPIPQKLQDLRRIDMRQDFEPGFLELLESLRKHKNSGDDADTD
jgi:TIR domain